MKKKKIVRIKYLKFRDRMMSHSAIFFLLGRNIQSTRAAKTSVTIKHLMIFHHIYENMAFSLDASMLSVVWYVLWNFTDKKDRVKY